MKLVVTPRGDSRLLSLMPKHYSQPKGFVGRTICYAITHDGEYYGHTVAGSAGLHLPNRNEFFGITKAQLNNVVNNTFFHVERVGGRYPFRNFVAAVVGEWRARVVEDWQAKYGDEVLGFETLVEPPRTGDCYKRDGWVVIGRTKGFTCKRVGGVGTDSWDGCRVWDRVNLRPKLVLARHVTVCPDNAVDLSAHQPLGSKAPFRPGRVPSADPVPDAS